ncbi:LAMI_0C04126g1_1 [Lachancea mirantina]|uniref:LAMI_0C04126g1_1 n=1 Tax=Lachancea mirantina TaxID=1230905 RepID=A0A1G4J2S0_9SACH|nr:LAMI_0C04126g1_1 [Lachancea mirantina]
MSSRALRKLAGNNSLEATLAKLTGHPEDVAAVEDEPVNKKPVNIGFSALMGNDDDSSDEESVEEPKAPSPEPERIQTCTKSQKKKNRKAKKNEKKKKAPTGAPVDAANDAGHSSEEELDRIIRQFHKKDLEKQRESPSNDLESDYDTAKESEIEDSDDKIQSGFGIDINMDPGFTTFFAFSEFEKFFGHVDMRNLNPDNEFRLLFDDLSPESLADADSMTSTHVSPQVLRQLEKMKKHVGNWGGKDRRTAPNGSTVRRLAFTKIRDDWLPTPRGELTFRSLTPKELEQWQCWQRPEDWKDEIQNTLKFWKNSGLEFYKFDAVSTELNKKSLSEFFVNVVLQPDHEALINMISSRYPYCVPALLQVALILVRQGDKTNSNGLVERALFVFDRALKAHVRFNGLNCQLPYIFFHNRQFYLAIFRYIQIISQRGAASTASNWCKVLWSLSPLEDPFGCRYFMDHYLLANKEYNYLIKLSKSPLIGTYTQWYTFSLSLAFVLSYLKLDLATDARNELQKAFSAHTASFIRVFLEVLLGDPQKLGDVAQIKETKAQALESQAYVVRMKAAWGPSELSFLHSELVHIFENCHNKHEIGSGATREPVAESNFFVSGISVNLLRFAILSQESSLMACIPEEVWSHFEVYEFDVLAPNPIDRQSEEVVETIKSFTDERTLMMSQLEGMQDDELLNQVQQLSLQQLLDETQIQADNSE